ncbi:hypothetical protein FACS189454_00960 [Planctomycetales bacterium]|nr:hypothetical protein FACS189454_00960 [Planctomycetales bacterium]
MKRLFFAIAFALCLFLWSSEKRTAAQEERNYESSMIVSAFRGKGIQMKSKRNADGTYTDTFQDSDGNPISETEQYYLKGYDKISVYMMDASLIAESEGNGAPAGLMFRYGTDPDFRAVTGITAEQVGKFNLSMWDMQEYPTDEILDVMVQAGKTNDAAELETLGQKYAGHIINQENFLWNELSKIVTPEQMLKLRELELQMPPNATSGLTDFYVNFRAYEGLELTEEQKNQLKTLQEEYVKDQKELIKAMRSKKDQKEASEKLMKLSASVKGRIEMLLTAAQKAKRTRLLETRPKWLVSSVSSDQDKPKEDNSWMNSWKPGDGPPNDRWKDFIPPPPKRRFPLHE